MWVMSKAWPSLVMHCLSGVVVAQTSRKGIPQPCTALFISKFLHFQIVLSCTQHMTTRVSLFFFFVLMSCYYYVNGLRNTVLMCSPYDQFSFLSHLVTLFPLHGLYGIKWYDEFQWWFGRNANWSGCCLFNIPFLNMMWLFSSHLPGRTEVN